MYSENEEHTLPASVDRPGTQQKVKIEQTENETKVVGISIAGDI